MAEQKTQKLYEEIAAKMLAQIEEGVLRPGDRLPPERALAEEYGVSRTAIREALRSLEMMGCVESHVGEGTFIKAPSLSDIVDPFSMIIAQNGRMGSELIEARLILETEIAALAARRRTESSWPRWSEPWRKWPGILKKAAWASKLTKTSTVSWRKPQAMKPCA